jgi:hypothetical protein
LLPNGGNVPATECTVDTNEPNYPYDQNTFGLITRLAAQIKQVSAKHGVPPIAVAGSIADEYNVQRGIRKIWDWFQDSVVFTYLPASFIGFDFGVGINSKAFNATRNDIGPGNINIGTAREMYLLYKNAFPRELDDWAQLVDFILTERGTVIVAALVIRKGKSDLAPWLAGRSPEIQEALLVTYFKQGPRFIARYKAHLRERGHSGSVMVPGEGCRVFHQRGRFKTALGL